jgi:choline dehydrogenase-like flavoprotein
MASAKSPRTYDYAVIGSGFGGAVSAMRLGEKGYRVLVLERGKRYEDEMSPQRLQEYKARVADYRRRLKV